jgi:hypothetical protein
LFGEAAFDFYRVASLFFPENQGLQIFLRDIWAWVEKNLDFRFLHSQRLAIRFSG